MHLWWYSSLFKHHNPYVCILHNIIVEGNKVSYMAIGNLSFKLFLKWFFSGSGAGQAATDDGDNNSRAADGISGWEFYLHYKCGFFTWLCLFDIVSIQLCRNQSRCFRFYLIWRANKERRRDAKKAWWARWQHHNGKTTLECFWLLLPAASCHWLLVRSQKENVNLSTMGH